MDGAAEEYHIDTADRERSVMRVHERRDSHPQKASEGYGGQGWSAALDRAWAQERAGAAQERPSACNTNPRPPGPSCSNDSHEHALLNAI